MTTSKKKSDGDSASFEASTEKLESMIATLEEDGTSLEQSLQTFEEGIKLVRASQKALQQAEQKVSLLLNDNGEPQATNLEPGENQK